MSICSHTSNSEPYTGTISTCTACHLTIIYDGTRWVWCHSLTNRKFRKLRISFEVDRLTGKHVTSVP